MWSGTRVRVDGYQHLLSVQDFQPHNGLYRPIHGRFNRFTNFLFIGDFFMMAKENKAVSLQMPRALWAELKLLSRRNRRSLSAEIVNVVELHLRALRSVRPRPIDVIDRGEENECS